MDLSAARADSGISSPVNEPPAGEVRRNGSAGASVSVSLVANRVASIVSVLNACPRNSAIGVFAEIWTLFGVHESGGAHETALKIPGCDLGSAELLFEGIAQKYFVQTRAAGKNIDGGAGVFGPGVNRDVGFGDDDDAADAVRAEVVKDVGDDRAVGLANGVDDDFFDFVGMREFEGVATVIFQEHVFAKGFHKSGSIVERIVRGALAANVRFFKKRNAAHVGVREVNAADIGLHGTASFAPNEAGRGRDHAVAPNPDVEIFNLRGNVWVGAFEVV